MSASGCDLPDCSRPGEPWQIANIEPSLSALMVMWWTAMTSCARMKPKRESTPSSWRTATMQSSGNSTVRFAIFRPNEKVGVMSSVVPLFKGRGFDDEATQILGKAYDIACRSLHRKGQPPRRKVRIFPGTTER